ncbi:MAG: putative Tic20 family protein, partial [Gammaproteobacteria bacterium]
SSEQNQETASDKADVNQEAMIIQLSGLAGYIVPLGSLIVPLILWLIWRGKDPYLDKMGREAVNFQLSILVYYIISLVLCLLLIGFLLLFAAAIFHLAYIIIGAVQTSHGVNYRYPMIIRFLKQEKFPNSIISSEKK